MWIGFSNALFRPRAAAASPWRPLGVPRAARQGQDAGRKAPDLRKVQRRKDRGRAVQLWTWSEATAWRKIKEVMEAANITGVQASAKGLRHGFGVAAVQASIPLNLVQRWLGHAQLSTTAIYAEAVGQEEYDLVARMWG